MAVNALSGFLVPERVQCPDGLIEAALDVGRTRGREIDLADLGSGGHVRAVGPGILGPDGAGQQRQCGNSDPAVCRPREAGIKGSGTAPVAADFT